MKRFLLLGMVLAGAVLPMSVFAAETINDFDVQASISRGDDLLVKERITYDFGDDFRHGIYRYLPESLTVNYRKVPTGLRWLAVTRDENQEPYTVESTNGNSLAKVGDADVTIKEEHVYQLTYQVARSVVATEDKGQRFSWNVTGDDWDAPIEKSSFYLDSPVAPTNVQCFTGSRGSTGRDCEISNTGGKIIARTTRQLGPQEGWTIEATYPDGTFIPAAIESTPLIPWLRPWMLFGLLFSLFWGVVWFKFGRDPKGRGTVIPEFNPPEGWKPYEVNALVTEGGNHRALAATIIDLSRRGALTLTILDEGKSYRIERKRDGEKNLDDYEQKVIELLFVDGDEFQASQDDPKRANLYYRLGMLLPKHLVEHGWHRWNTGFARGVATVAVFLSFAGAFYVAYSYFNDPLLFLGGFGLIIALVFAHYMPKRTERGSLMLEHIKGFKEYIRVAEKDRLAFHEAPARTPERFTQLLPFAVALGLEKQWGKLFADIVLPGTEAGSSNALVYASQIGILSHNLSSDMRSFSVATVSSSGGGGGSSGGGGGGGGGGSW